MLTQNQLKVAFAQAGLSAQGLIEPHRLICALDEMVKPHTFDRQLLAQLLEAQSRASQAGVQLNWFMHRVLAADSLILERLQEQVRLKQDLRTKSRKLKAQLAGSSVHQLEQRKSLNGLIRECQQRISEADAQLQETRGLARLLQTAFSRTPQLIIPAPQDTPQECGHIDLRITALNALYLVLTVVILANNLFRPDFISLLVLALLAALFQASYFDPQTVPLLWAVFGLTALYDSLWLCLAASGQLDGQVLQWTSSFSGPWKPVMIGTTALSLGLKVSGFVLLFGAEQYPEYKRVQYRCAWQLRQAMVVGRCPLSQALE